MPSVTNLHLISDTGSSATDKITTNGTLAGSVATGGQSIYIQYDTNSDGVADGASVYPNTSGDFQISSLASMPGTTVNVRVRSAKMMMNPMTMMMSTEYGDWSDTFSFTLNMPPMATSGSANVLENASKTVTLGGTDMGSTDPLTAQLVGQPAHGTASLTGNSLTYTPAENFTGTDSVQFIVKDSAGEASGAVSYTFTMTGISIQLIKGSTVSFQDEGTTVNEVVIKEMVTCNVMPFIPLGVDASSAVGFLKTTGPVKLYLDPGRIHEIDPAHAYSFTIGSPNQLPTIVYAVADGAGLCEVIGEPKMNFKSAGDLGWASFTTTSFSENLKDRLSSAVSSAIEASVDAQYKPFRDDVITQMQAELATELLQNGETQYATNLRATIAHVDSLFAGIRASLIDDVREEVNIKVTGFVGVGSPIANYLTELDGLSSPTVSRIVAGTPDKLYLFWDASPQFRNPFTELYPLIMNNDSRQGITGGNMDNVEAAMLGVGLFFTGLKTSLTLRDANKTYIQVEVFGELSTADRMARDFDTGRITISDEIRKGVSGTINLGPIGLRAGYEQLYPGSPLFKTINLVPAIGGQP